MNRRTFLASAGFVSAIGAVKEEHDLEGGEVLRLQRGDLVILRCPDTLSMDTLLRLRDSFQEHVPEGVKVCVLDCGLAVSVLRPEP